MSLSSHENPYKHCGGRLHDKNNCPTRNLVLLLNGKPPERWDANLPDMVVVMGDEDFIKKIEEVRQK